MEILMFVSHYFSKKLTCLPLPQHRIRSKTGISLEITLNAFKCLIVSLVPLKFLLWLQHYNYLFQLGSSAISLWYQVCIFYCPLRRKRCTVLPEGKDVYIQQHIHQEDLNLCLSLYYHPKAIVELEKTQTRNCPRVLWCL